MSRIMLEWDDESASVLAQKDGRTFEIGTVILKTLAFTIVGCTYYHHLLAITCDATRSEMYQTQLAKIRAGVDKLHRAHPEITAKNLHLDTPRNPTFLDLRIPIKFPIPFLFTDSYSEQVQKRILPYTQLLKPVYNLEVMHLQEGF